MSTSRNAGSALGTVIAQWGMAAWLGALAAREARRLGIALAPIPRAMHDTAQAGGWLLLRTLWLRIALLATTIIATQAGTTALASTHIAMSIYLTVGFALDALAIAGQAMLGKALGASDVSAARAVTNRLTQWGVGFGVVCGAGLAAMSPVAGNVFTSDAEVLAALPAVLLILGLSQPILGLVCVLDGVLIGAGDARYLAWTGLANLVVYLPLLALALVVGWSALVIIWLAFGFGYLGARATTLRLRVRSDAWLRTGAIR